MTSQVDIRRSSGRLFELVHCLVPAWQEGDTVSTSEPGSIALAFTAQAAAVVREPGGAARQRAVPPQTIGLCGETPISWLQTDAPSDIVEITGAETLRNDLAYELRVGSNAMLADIHGWNDPVIQAIALRLRAALRGWFSMSEMEGEVLVRAAYARSLQQHFGASQGAGGTLDARRRNRTLELIATSTEPLSLTALADAAALSPFHFTRSFTATFGMPPHRYVTITRLERASQALKATTITVGDAAALAGFSNLHHFRRLFRRHYGVLPSDVASGSGKNSKNGASPALRHA